MKIDFKVLKLTTATGREKSVSDVTDLGLGLSTVLSSQHSGNKSIFRKMISSLNIKRSECMVLSLIMPKLTVFFTVRYLDLGQVVAVYKFDPYSIV